MALIIETFGAYVAGKLLPGVRQGGILWEIYENFQAGFMGRKKIWSFQIDDSQTPPFPQKNSHYPKMIFSMFQIILSQTKEIGTIFFN